MRHLCVFFFWMTITTSFAQVRKIPYGSPYSRLTVDLRSVDWRRDVYREVDLRDKNNTGLAYKDNDNNENLFERLFNLILTNKIKAYKFVLDGQESFDKNHVVDIKEVLDDFRIFYDEDSTGIKIDDFDMPTNEIRMYYIKEMMYHDVTNSMFGKTPLALCPVIIREDEDMGASKYPMFWVEYDDLFPYIQDLFIYPNSRNMIDRMSLADYFARNLYKGKVYRDFNISGDFSAWEETSDNDIIQKQRVTPDDEFIELKQRSFNIFRDSKK